MAGFFEITASHERRSDSLSQGNGSRNRQGLFTRKGKKNATRAALPHLVKAPQHLLERLERRAKQLGCAPWTTNAIITVERHAQPQRARHDATMPPAVSGSGSDPQLKSNRICVGRIGLRQPQYNGSHEDCIGSAFSSPRQEGSEMSQLDGPFCSYARNRLFISHDSLVRLACISNAHSLHFFL